MTVIYTGYLQKYLPLIERGLDANVRKDKIARDLFKIGVHPWWTEDEETAVSAMAAIISYIGRKRRGVTKDKWIVSTPQSVEREIQIERGE